MKIAVDARSIDRPRSGVGAYTQGLVSALKRRQALTIKELHFGGAPGRLLPGRIVNQLYKWRLLPPLNLFVRADIFLFPDFIKLPLFRKPSVAVIHDLTYLRFPRSMDQKNRYFLEKEVPRTLKRATHIVVNSQATKRDIEKRYVSTTTKISVVYPGVDLQRYKPASADRIQKIQKKYGLNKNYVLFVGTVEPRKNIPTLIRAYNQLPKSIQKSHQLVIAGGKGWGDELGRLMEEIKNDQIVMIGHVDQDDIAAIYSGAAVFVMPSLFEGFGIPVIEAMACGTPVISADNSSLPEAAGSAALMFKATDEETLTEHIKTVLTDDRKAKRMIEDGLKHARQFTWKNSADKLQSILTAVLKG